jgi:hypothetical protein
LIHVSPVVDAVGRGDTMQPSGEPQKLPRQFRTTVQSDDLSGHVVHNYGGMHMNTPTDAKVPPKEVTVPESVPYDGHSSERFASAGVVRRQDCTLACWRASQPIA